MDHKDCKVPFFNNDNFHRKKLKYKLDEYKFLYFLEFELTMSEFYLESCKIL